jgi:hypothetical protein
MYMIADSRPRLDNRIAPPAELLDRMPAEADDAERQLLGSILIDPTVWADVAAIIAEHDLRLPQHRRLWRELAAMIADGEPVDVTLLRDRLGVNGMEEAGGIAYLAEIVDAVPTAHNAKYYATKVKDRSTQRQIGDVGLDLFRLSRGSSGPGRDARSLLTEAAEIIGRLPDVDRDDDAAPADDGYRPLPVDALPQTVRDLVTAGAAAIGCDESYIALPALAMLGAAIGDTRVISPKRTWREPPTLWTAIVAETGSAKTPALRLALGAVHRRQDRALDKLSAAPKRYYTTDCTVEALARLLAREPRGVLVCPDELAGWMRSQNQYRSGGRGADTQHWLSTYDGASVLIDRRSTETPYLHLPRPLVSLTGGIQPAILRACLAGEHMVDGLSHRLMMTMPPRHVPRWRDAGVAREIEEAIDALVNGLYDGLQRATSDYGPEPRIVRLSREAHREYRTWYDGWIDRERALADEHLRGAAPKVRGRVLRLALILHCVRQVEAGVIDDAEAEALTIRDAIALAEWSWGETERIYGMLGESPADSARRDLAALIADRPGRCITAKQLKEASRRYRPPGAAQLALDGLVAAGLARWEVRSAGPHGGRPARVCALTGTGGPGTQTSPNAGKNGDKVPGPAVPEIESGEV